MPKTVVKEQTVETQTPAEVGVLTPTDAGWQDYVLSQFTDSDKDPDGNPTAEACRLVAERLLGTIVSEKIRTVQLPCEDNDYRATVEVSVTIAWGGDRDDLRTFEDVADVYPGNMDPRFAMFPCASAKTKALGRAYKSALKLKRVYTSEELATKDVVIPGGGFAKVITLSQRRFVEKLCRELNINVMGFINSGKRKYSDIIQIPYATADTMIQHLNDYQQDPKSIPDEVRGYIPNWQKDGGIQ